MKELLWRQQGPINKQKSSRPMSRSLLQEFKIFQVLQSFWNPFFYLDSILHHLLSQDFKKVLKYSKYLWNLL